jgi:hypothetical protein
LRSAAATNTLFCEDESKIVAICTNLKLAVGIRGLLLRRFQWLRAF